jgi:rubredoxin
MDNIDKDKYFRCNICGYVFDIETKEYVKDTDIQNYIKNIKNVNWGYCKDCLEYKLKDVK